MNAPRLHVLASLLIVLAACGGDDDASTATTATPTTDAVTTTTPTSTAPPVTEPTPITAAPATTPTTTTPPKTAPAVEPWQPVDAGPYEVGVQTVVIDDPDRPLTVDVWFPIGGDVDTGTLTPHRYTLLPGVFYESPDALTASPEAAATDGPFPLVAYSHGSGGIRYLHSSYTEALASHGHVVVAPDHTGNTVFDRFAGAGPDETIAFLRPNDIARVLDAFTDTAHPTAGPFAAAVDPERIALTGHSFGGYTSVALATGVTTPAGDVAPDPRVDAVVPLAPATGANLLTDELVATLDVPMMIVVGTDDTTTPVDPNVTRLWELTDVAPAYRVELVAGEHQTFTDLCAYADFLPSLPDVPEVVVDTITDFGAEGCSPGDIPADRAAELTNSYVIRFLDEVFRGGESIDPDVVATPDDVIFDRR